MKRNFSRVNLINLSCSNRSSTKPFSLKMFHIFSSRSTNSISVKISSSAEIRMDSFDQQWKAYTKRCNFFSNYNIVHHTEPHAMCKLKSWYHKIMRSQFNHSSDQYDSLLLDHWIIEYGNEEDFIVNKQPVPFHAIIKTPVMEHWYSQVYDNNQPNVLIAYTGQSRRTPLLDEHTVMQPFYHSRRDCPINSSCFTTKICKKDEPGRQITMAEIRRLADEIF